MIHANSLLDLVSPGKLSGVHQVEQIECEGCHKAGDKSAQVGLCLDCHEGIRRDIESVQGLHGRHTVNTGSRCSGCHTEHEGADADIGGLQPETFDHDLTDFSLAGAHRSLGCNDCHENRTPKRETPAACVGCHDTPHKSRKFDDCQTCHEQMRWGRVDYEHELRNFALTGAHDTVQCKACHGIGDFSTRGEDCVDCHAIKDAHGGLFGGRCEDCHGQSVWGKVTFDHEAKTGYPLVGAHDRALCHDCHRYDREPPESGRCYGCHVSNDIHTGNNGEDCGGCHTAKTWRIDRFDHLAVSEFALRGKHKSVTCSLCHKAGIDVVLDDKCASCHSLGDVHRGALGQECESCHSERDWGDVDFDHNRDTGFELRQSHRQLECRACHKSGRTWKQPPRCVACHEKENVHGDDSSSDCENCHDESDWSRAVLFHHDLTVFPLLGMHGLVFCESCHADNRFSDSGTACENCHEGIDPHNGTYGSGCEACHNPNAWSSWRFNHDETEFPLEGAHLELTCRACHSDGSTPDSAPSECAECHRQDDIHQGRFGNDCGECHNSHSFREIDINAPRPGHRGMVRQQ